VAVALMALADHFAGGGVQRRWAAPRFPDCGFRVHLRGEL
jgi:hypothetical protein